MRRMLGVAMLLAAAGLWLSACGSGEDDEKAAAERPKVQQAEDPRAPAAGEPQQEREVAPLVWAGSGAPGDKAADTDKCRKRVEKIDEAKGGQSAMGKMQRWYRCMGKLGWKRKT